MLRIKQCYWQLKQIVVHCVIQLAKVATMNDNFVIHDCAVLFIKGLLLLSNNNIEFHSFGHMTSSANHLLSCVFRVSYSHSSLHFGIAIL